MGDTYAEMILRIGARGCEGGANWDKQVAADWLGVRVGR